MNRYWGRNNDEASHRFTRDDDQLLALNYENLCDGDYLGRLFVNDSGNTHKEDITTESSGTQFVDHDNDIFNSDIAEDLIVYGDTKELGRRFFRKRFYRDVGAYKHQDSISSIVNKQSIIFEHIGKLMVEKCSQSPPDVSDVVVDENEKSSSNDVLSVEHLAGRAISSTLTVLERNFHLKVRQSTLDPILSILYQALGDSSPSLSVWLPQHYSCLRALLTKGLLKGLGRISSEKNKEMSLFRMEENIKVSMNCVYGLVVLGLQANDFADLTLAVAFLVLIILRVEEWKCNYEKEIDARIAKINSSKRTTPGPEVMVVTEKADTKSAIQAKREMKRLGSNNNNKLPTKPTSSQSTSHTKPNTPGSTLLPLPKAGVLAAGEDERNDLSLVDAPTKPITIKSWEKPTKSSLIAEMELKSKIQVVKNKGDIKANLNNYITPNQQNVIVNHVTVQYNNINSNNSINISTNSNNHHDNIQTESSNQHAHGKRPANLSSAGHDPISPDKKKEIKRARDTMKNLMKIPQSVLDLLHSRCVAISRDMSKAETSKTASLGAINPRNSFSLSSSRKGKSSYVWSCGQNSYGELGLGDTALRKSFAKINALDRKNIVSIGAGNEHSVFVTNDGKLLASGYNDNGQCGVSAGLGSAQQVKLPTVIQALEGEEITRVHVYNGCEHTLAVTKDGKLFSFGYNYRGQLGLGSTTSEFTPRPVRGLMSRKVILAACSYHHSFMLCLDGTLFSCGRNDSGQLGHGDTIDKKTPQMVANWPQGITSISCGQFHTVVASSAGAAYVCGKNDYGQLGLDVQGSVKVFTKIPILPEMERIFQVCCGYYHTLLLSNNGIISGFGRNDYGQLGLGHAQPKVFHSTVVTSLRDKAVTMLSAGCYHSVAVTANGMLYMFGRNNHGQLGTGDLEERHAPHPVDDFIGQHIVSVAAGFYHTIVLTSDNADNNSATLMGFQVVGSTIVKSIPDPAVEYESVSSNLFPGWNSEASMSVLLKDSKLLANVTTDDAVSPTTKARAEAGNKAMIYELLRFMMNHIEDFSLVKSGTISFALRSYTKTNRLLELDQSLSSIVMLIKFCADSVTSSQSIIEISTFEALTCILKLIRIVAVLISKEKTLIEVTLRRNSKIDELSSSWQNLLTKPMTRDKVELVELRQAFEQLSARASSDRIANEMDSDAKVALEDGSSDLSVLLKLRQLLLQLYFHLKVEEDTRWLLLEICAEIANCLSTSHTVFFPRASLESKFVAMLKENGIVKNEDRELSPQASLQEMKLSFELSNLRLLTAYCSIYRTGDEVITLFQKSKMDGLIVFRQLVSAYSYFSKQVMDHRISGSSHFRQNDIRKSINVLEHSITAFIKSAIPLILTASCSPTTEIILITSGLDIGSILGDEKLEIQRYGAEIFCDVLIDAENILDSLLSQALNEDILGQLRYGTIMPSILPSIILYAISFSKYGCVILEVLPQLQHIIKKLQLLGKCELKLPSKVTAPSPNTSTGGSQAGSEDGESAQANEDILMNRKDSPNVSWWYRLMKLMIHYYGKICSCLVTVPFKALYQQDMRNDLTDSRSTYRSEVWWFVHPNCDLIHENLLSITTILNAAIEENQNYDEVRKITIRYREQEKEVDPMYRMLSSSSHLSFSGQIFNAMEEVMMKAIISVIGIPIAEVLLRDSFKMITRFVKSIQSKKSSIIACMEQTSWIEILTLMYNIIKFFCDVFVQGSCRISNQPLDIPILQKYKYRAQWRKVLLITTVLKRWKKARVLKAKNISNIIVEYIGRMVSTMTQNYTIFTVEEVAQRLEFVATSYINADSSILKFNLGVQTCLSLLEDVSSVSFQNDLIQSMLLSIKLCNSSNPSHDEVRIRNTICVSKHTNHELKSSTMAIILYITRTMEKISSAASIPSGDITKVGQLMKLLYLLSDSELGLLDPSEILLRIPFQLMKKIVTALNSNYTSVSTNPAEEKSGKKTINQRDKSQIYRKATSAIITTIEALVFSITDSNRQTYVGSMIPLLNVVNDLLNDYEKISSETTNSEENESQDSSSKNKDANAKKRCQDLITKPIEFCKASEGYVLPGEKLMNNYKSIDFTVATWIFITKKNCDNKYNFIAGKVNHNDAWPIIVVRNDGKLEVCYGHNNELEKITSEGSIPFYVWTHIGFVIEQKKIKIFINGALDIQSNTTKGNSRAVLYPLVIGSCPISIRSRVNHIRDGFDGMLAQFKYYSRALSPIHIKFICDGGPPESGDFYEQWIYKLITCVKCIVEATTWNEETEACTATACLLHKLYVRNRSQRIKFASLDILCSMLKRNNLLLPNLELTATKSINTISNSSCEGEVPDPSCDLNKSRSGDSKRRSGNVRLEEAPFLQDADSLEKKMILYFIRTLGLCWHQPKASDDSKNELLSQLYKHLATDDVSKAAAESMDEINLEKKYNYIMLKEFTGYIPSLAIVDNVNSNLSSLLQGSGTNSSVSEKMLDNQVVREELSFHIVKCLRNLARASPIWSSAISSVVSEVFEKYQLFLERIEEPSSLLLTDIIGCTILLGGDKYSYHIGMDVLTNYNSNLGRVIYLNRSTNSAIVLTVSSSLMVKQILKVRLHDLVVKDDYCLLHLSEGIVASAVKILNSMDKYVGIVLNDLLLSDHPDHPFQNKIVLTCSRPLELFIFSKLLRSLTRVNKYSINLSEHRNLFEVLQQAAVSITNMSSDSESVVENNSAGEARFLQWTSCARYIQSLPSKLVQLPLLTTERSRTIFDYVSKHLGIALESLQSTPYEKLLLGGRLSELVQSLAIGASKIRNRENLDSESDFSTYEQVVMSDWSSNSMALLSNFYSPNEEEIKRVLQLLISFRTSIISSSRTILSIARNAEKTELVSQTTPWNIILWQSILPKLTSQRTAFSIIQKDYVFQLNFTWTLISQQFFDTNKLEVTQSLASALRYSALSLLQLHAIKAPGNLLESTDIFKKALQTMVYWLEYNNDRPNPELLFYQMLRILLPSLSFIECSKVELQLMQLCLFAINKICLKIFDGYIPTKDLLDLAKSNNFTLLRARAQEQIIKYKGHNLGSVSPLAYNLTQLVAGLEIIQRHAVNNSSPVLQRQTSGSTKSSKITNTLQIAKIQSIETAAPKIVGVRSTSVDADLADCALTAIQLLYLTAFQYNCDTNESSNPLGDQSPISQDGVLRPTGKSIAEKNIMIEVAISCGQTGNDMCFDTVYCGTSLRFVQSGLVPDCFYHMKCRAYVGALPLSWSPIINFKTDKGILFSFDTMKAGNDILLSDDGLTASYSGDDTWSTILASKSFSSGITSWEVRVNQSSTAYIFVGVASSAVDLNTFLGGCSKGYGFIGEQALYHNREKVKIYGETFGAGDVIGVTLDLYHGTLSFTKNKKSLGVAFDKIYGELFPAVAFYNVGQEIELLIDGFKTNCPCEPIPISPSRLNIDDISLLNELVLSMYHNFSLSHRLLVLVVEQCNQWCTSLYVRCRTVSGRDIFISKESPLLKRFGLVAGERVRTTYGVAEVAGSTFNKIWFKMNPAGEVWFFSIQQITDGRMKKLFTRCSYDVKDSTNSDSTNVISRNKSSENFLYATYDVSSVQDYLDPSKWNEEMDNILMNFLVKQCELKGLTTPFEISAETVYENFRELQQQLSKVVISSHSLTHRWGISGPKRKAVLARIGEIRLLNQMLEMYLPFLISDSASNSFLKDSAQTLDDYNPVIISLDRTFDTGTAPIISSQADKNISTLLPVVLSWRKTPRNTCPVGPLHTMRRRIFQHTKLNHFWEVVKKTTTRPAKTEDDYDYPEDLPHLHINRLKSFRAKEASELMNIPGEDLMMSSIFVQMWRELGLFSSERLRISYTHPMDDGQSRTFKIKFDGEGVDDYGGPYREIFQQMCDELQTADPSGSDGDDRRRPSTWASGQDINASNSRFADKDTIAPVKCLLPLLLPTKNWTAGECEEKYKYTFHPASTADFHLSLYRFLGQILGIAVRSKITLDLSLPSYIWKYVVGEPLLDTDLLSFDTTAYIFVKRASSLLARISSNAEEDIAQRPFLTECLSDLVSDLTWTVTRSDGLVVELIPGGATMTIDVVDVDKYLELYVATRLSESKPAIEKFREGLISIIPESSLSLLNWEELESVVCGSRTIDIKRLKENTEYDDDISAEDDHIINFWSVLEDFTEEEKSLFLKFVWARPTLPPKGVEFTQKMRVLSAVGDDAVSSPDNYLPKAHTCFFSINLPKYSSKEIIAEKLRYAIRNCTEMDADFRTTEIEVAGWSAATASQAEWVQ